MQNYCFLNNRGVRGLKMPQIKYVQMHLIRFAVCNCILYTTVLSSLHVVMINFR
jgi:hypothetical protein